MTHSQEPQATKPAQDKTLPNYRLTDWAAQLRGQWPCSPRTVGPQPESCYQARMSPAISRCPKSSPSLQRPECGGNRHICSPLPPPSRWSLRGAASAVWHCSYSCFLSEVLSSLTKAAAPRPAFVVDAKIGLSETRWSAAGRRLWRHGGPMDVVEGIGRSGGRNSAL